MLVFQVCSPEHCWNDFFIHELDREKVACSAPITDSSQYSGLDKARVLVYGGILPFGTLADDPWEPSYKDVIVSKFVDSPTAALIELGVMSS